jgi:hypothetical protein
VKSQRKARKCELKNWDIFNSHLEIECRTNLIVNEHLKIDQLAFNIWVKGQGLLGREKIQKESRLLPNFLQSAGILMTVHLKIIQVFADHSFMYQSMCSCA